MAGEAKAEAEQAVAEAKLKADAIRKKGQEQANGVRAEIMARARQDADRPSLWKRVVNCLHK